jgi:hypothetical protein
MCALTWLVSKMNGLISRATRHIATTTSMQKITATEPKQMSTTLAVVPIGGNGVDEEELGRDILL